MSDWEVPGYEVLCLLGYGTTGEVWRARSGGGLVALRRLAGTDRDALAEVRRLATVVRSLPTRHVVRLRSITRAQGDEVLVLDHADSGSLASLVSSRGALSPGEVVTVLAPVAEALGLAHAHGLCHRRLGAGSVLLSRDGMPMLDGLGLDALHDPRDSLDPTGVLGPTADVWAVGALGHLLLAGAGDAPLPPTVPLPLVEALAAATDPDPLARPTAEALAAQLLAACPAQPLLGLPAPPEVPARPQPRRHRSLLLPAAAVTALLAVVGIGWTWGSRGAPATASVTAVPTDWPAVLSGLDAARSSAFAAGSGEALSDVYADGSALLDQDAAAMADLRRRGVTARGLRHVLQSVTAGAVADGRVLLLVRQSLSPYELVDTHGTVLERHTTGPLVVTEVTLVREPGGWRVQGVKPGA